MLMPKRLKTWATGPVESRYDKLKRDSPSRGGGRDVVLGSKGGMSGVTVGTAWPGESEGDESECYKSHRW